MRKMNLGINAPINEKTMKTTSQWVRQMNRG
jgi:hypothetical protein